MHQASAAFALGFDIRNNSGFCHGYSEFWAQNLLKYTIQINAHRADPLPITQTVLELQKQKLYTYTWQRLVGNRARYFAAANDLIEHLVQEIIIKNYFSNQMLIICLTSTPKFNFLPTIKQRIYQHNPRLCNQWHEVRFFCDKEGYMHWFDANVGWFKSNVPSPGVDSIRLFIAQLFSILQYDKFQMLDYYPEKQYPLELKTNVRFNFI